MTTRAACASTAFLTATTWATVDATSFNSVETTTTALTTSYQTSSTFTPGAITIDGIGVRLSVRTGTTGTITVALDLATVDVAGTVVTINCSDLPAAVSALLDGGWIFFKFAAPVTLAGATAYGVKAKTSSSAQVSLFSTATTNWARYLRTTTTGAPTTGDDLIIAKEWTAANTGTARSVTMDETAATDYGSAPSAALGLVTPGIAICQGGTLAFKDTSAANPYLRLSNSLIVYNGGTLNIGTTGTPIPRDSTAILEFDLAADGDYGFIARNGSTVTKQGLSRTVGKNVVSAKLTADSSVNLVQAINPVGVNISGAAVTTTLDPTGISLAVGFTSSGTFNQLTGWSDSAANANHAAYWTGLVSVTATTQVFTVWLKRGSGTNNRFVRLQLAVGNALPATNGFYADFDLQTPSAGTCTALGNGTATSAAITAFGAGFICTIIGKISSGASVPTALIGLCNASGVVSYVGDATQNIISSWPRVYTLAAQPTQDTIDTDTGWLSGDVVALASTTRTAAECEVASLNGNAGASTLTYNLYPVNARSGTSPTQAEVILLSRNVKVRSTSPTLMTYVQIKSGAVVDIDWAEFYYIGVSGAGISAVDVEVNTTAATNFSMQFSSIHDTEVNGFLVRATAAGGTLTSLVFSSNTLWNCSTTTGPAAQINGAVTATSYTFDSNILLRTGAGNGWTLSDVGGTFTNNTVVGAASFAFNLNESNATLGTFSGNVAHSNTSNGLQCAVATAGTVTNYAGWRNTGVGINLNAQMNDIIFDSAALFGNTTNNVTITAALFGGVIKNSTFNGDTTFATANGINIGVVNASASIVIDSCDFSTVSGIKTAHTNDINVSSLFAFAIVMRNTKLGAATEVATPSNFSNNGFIASEKHDQTAGNHLTYMKNGLIQTDTTIFNTLSPSMRMTPTSASLKLESAYQFQGIKAAVASGASVTIAVSTRKSVVGDGTAYNGNQPRLILKANPAIGIATDTVIQTASAAAGSWGQISGTTAAATDDGVMEFVVDCDGTTGWVNVDDWSAS